MRVSIGEFPKDLKFLSDLERRPKPKKWRDGALAGERGIE